MISYLRHDNFRSNDTATSRHSSHSSAEGTRAALALWREAGVRVLPGRYLGHDTVAENPASNPGFAYIRVALVADEATTETALRRLAACL